MNRLIISLKWVDFYLRKVLPDFIPSALRRVSSAFITPFHFSYYTGHFRSSIAKKPISKKGRPIPWYTYSLISYLENLDFSTCSVLEIGGGNSSLWWASRSQKVLCLESDPEWFNHLKNKNKFNNLELKLIEKNTLIEHIQSDTYEAPLKYDIVILDGMDRHLLIKDCIKLLSDQGILIADDSDRYDYSNALEGTGLNRIDFHGYAPSVILPKCSSIFFYPQCTLFANYEK